MGVACKPDTSLQLEFISRSRQKDLARELGLGIRYTSDLFYGWQFLQASKTEAVRLVVDTGSCLRAQRHTLGVQLLIVLQQPLIPLR